MQSIFISVKDSKFAPYHMFIVPRELMSTNSAFTPVIHTELEQKCKSTADHYGFPTKLQKAIAPSMILIRKDQYLYCQYFQIYLRWQLQTD